MPPYLYQTINNINRAFAYLYLLYNKHFADIQGRDQRLSLTICSNTWGPTAIRQKIIQRYQISFMPSDKLYTLLRYRTLKKQVIISKGLRKGLIFIVIFFEKDFYLTKLMKQIYSLQLKI